MKGISFNFINLIIGDYCYFLFIAILNLMINFVILGQLSASLKKSGTISIPFSTGFVASVIVVKSLMPQNPYSKGPILFLTSRT